MLRSLHLKFFIILFGVALIALSGTVAIRHLMVGDFTDYLEGTGEDRVYGLLANFEGAYESDGGWKEESQNRLVIWSLTEGFQVRVHNGQGGIVTDTGRAVEQASPALKRRLTALSGLTEAKDGYFFAPYPLFLGGKQIGTLELRPLRPAREAVFMRRAGRFLLFSVIAVGCLALVTSLLFSSWLTRPIKELAVAASAISRGDLSKRVRATRHDEVGHLASSFNRMADALASQESLRRKLIADVAHELRTPLAVMRGEIEAMIDGLMPTDEKRLESLHEETGRLKRMVEGIEELNQAEASVLNLKKQRILLLPFLQVIGDRLRPVFDKEGISLGLTCDAIAEVEADPERLSQIVINLLTNALKATEPGGNVVIEVATDKDTVSISVRDTGRGISEKNLPFVFERFFKGAEGGLGIGLTIVKELAEAHGGRVAAKSAEGEGSTFAVYLPERGLHNSS